MERLFAADRFLTVGPFPALKRRTCLAERGHSCRQLLPNATTGRFAVRFPQRPLLRTGMSALRAKRVRNAGLLSVVPLFMGTTLLTMLGFPGSENALQAVRPPPQASSLGGLVRVWR